MATVVLGKLGTDTIPVMDFGTYWGALSGLSNDVFDYWVLDRDEIANSEDIYPEEKEYVLSLIDEKYDGSEIFDQQVAEIAPKYIQQALDEYGIKAKVVPSSCHWYHPREYNYGDDTMDFSLEVDTDWVADTFMELSEDPNFIAYVKKRFSSYDGFISFIPNNVAELNKLLDPNDNNYWKVLSAIVSYFVSQDKSIRDEVTAEMVDYLYENSDFELMSTLGIY